MRLRTRWGKAMTALVLVIAAAGCTTRGTSVDHRMLLPQAGARHAVAPTQFFVMPVPLAAPEPMFPTIAGHAEAIDVTVCAEIWLSEDGGINRVMPFDATPECVQARSPRAAPYAKAMLEALQRWKFTPAMICEFPPQAMDKRERGDCTGPEVAVRRVAVRLEYAFTFTFRDGRKRVGVARKLPADAAPPDAAPPDPAAR